MRRSWSSASIASASLRESTSRLDLAALAAAADAGDESAWPAPLTGDRSAPDIFVGGVAAARRVSTAGGSPGRRVPQIVSAAAAGDADAVRALLQQGGEPAASAADPHGRTALHVACEALDARVVEAVLEAAAPGPAAPLAAVDAEGRTPLLTAVLSRRALDDPDALRAVLAALTRAGADVDARGGAKFAAETALHAAAKRGLVGPLTALLAAGAAVDALSADDGRTALALAATNGHADAVAALLGGGANAALADHGGLTPADYARALGRRDIARLIARWPDVGPSPRKDAPAAMTATTAAAATTAAGLAEGGAPGEGGAAGDGGAPPPTSGGAGASSAGRLRRSKRALVVDLAALLVVLSPLLALVAAVALARRATDEVDVRGGWGGGRRGGG